MQLNFISMPIVFKQEIKLCKQILTSFNGILTKSIMVNEMKILLILILIHNILAIGSILTLFCTIRPQCKFQFEQIYLIFKSWFVRYKFFFDCYHCFPWDQMSSPNKGRYPPLHDFSFLFVCELSNILVKGSMSQKLFERGQWSRLIIKTLSFVLLISRRGQQKCQYQISISFWWLKCTRQWHWWW